MIGKCKICRKEDEMHAKGMCYKCYKKQWKPQLITCKRCGRERYHHSKGYCTPCFNFLFHYDDLKAYNYRKSHNLDLGTYRKLTEKCVVCGFDKIIDLHHLDGNRTNNSETNLIGLCPNHHRLIHMYEFKEEVLKDLKEKGFNVKS